MVFIMMSTQFNDAGFKGIASNPRKRREVAAASFKRMGGSLKRCTTCLPQRNG